MKRIVLATILIFISACGQGGDVRAAVQKTLIDPESARFGKSFVSKDGRRACIDVNAKNSYGGYTGEQMIQLWKEGDDKEWTVGGSTGLVKCSKEFLDSTGH